MHQTVGDAAGAPYLQRCDVENVSDTNGGLRSVRPKFCFPLPLEPFAFKARVAPALTYLSKLLTPQETSCGVTCTDVALQAAPRSGLKKGICDKSPSAVEMTRYED